MHLPTLSPRHSRTHDVPSITQAKIWHCLMLSRCIAQLTETQCREALALGRLEWQPTQRSGYEKPRTTHDT